MRTEDEKKAYWRRYYAANRAHKLEYAAARYAEKRETLLEKAAAKYRADPEYRAKVKAQAKQWREDNKRPAAYYRDWRRRRRESAAAAT
jgi:hypothetical protein